MTGNQRGLIVAAQTPTSHKKRILLAALFLPFFISSSLSLSLAFSRYVLLSKGHGTIEDPAPEHSTGHHEERDLSGGAHGHTSGALRHPDPTGEHAVGNQPTRVCRKKEEEEETRAHNPGRYPNKHESMLKASAGHEAWVGIRKVSF